MAAKKTSKTAPKKPAAKTTVAKSKKTAASNQAASTTTAGKKKEAATNKKPATKTKAGSKSKITTKPESSKETVRWLAAGSQGEKPNISFNERERMISEAAFVISQNRDPHVGGPEIDWLQAEAVIDLIFSASE